MCGFYGPGFGDSHKSCVFVCMFVCAYALYVFMQCVCLCVRVCACAHACRYSGSGEAVTGFGIRDSPGGDSIETQSGETLVEETAAEDESQSRYIDLNV